MSQPMLIRVADDKKIEQLRNEPDSFAGYFFGPMDKQESTKPVTPEPPKSGGLFGLFHKKSAVPPPSPEKPPIARLWRILYEQSPEKRAEIAALPDWEIPSADDIVDIDKSYEILHPALTGKSILEGDESAASFLSPSEELMRESNGSPWWVLKSDKIAAALSEVDALKNDGLSKRLNEELLEEDEILAETIETMGMDDAVEYAEQNLETLIEILNRAQQKQQGLVFVVVV